MKIALIGHGRLGTLLAKNIVQDFDLGIFDKNKITNLPKGATQISLSELKNYQIVLLCLPINQIKNFCQEIKNQLHENTLVIDTCSVKEYPLEQMKDILPDNCSLLGTHPMFGPDSAKKTLWGSKIVLCPERIDQDQLRNIQNYLEGHGLKVIITSAKNHDQEIAQSLALTHFIGRGLIDYQATELEIDTKGHRRLMKILETVENDTIELFKDMNFYNSFARMGRKKFIEKLIEIDKNLDQNEEHPCE